MKYTYLLVVLLPLLLGHSIAKEKESPHFEGELWYAISYYPKDSQDEVSHLKDVIGSKMQLLFKEGNLKKTYYASNGTVVQERFLDLEKHRMYFRKPNRDTIHFFDIRIHESKVQFSEVKDSLYQGEIYTHLAMQSSFLSMHSPDSLYLNTQWLVSKKHTLDPLWYKEYTEGKTNEFMQLAQGHYIKLRLDNGYWIEVQECDSVKQRNVSKAELQFVQGEKEVLVQF